MKIAKILLSLSFIYLVLLLWSGTGVLTSCTKKVTIYDTTVIRDTTTLKDTTVVQDTVYDLTDGLVAYYNFNGGSLHDSSGHGNDINFSNATVAADRYGRPGNAYSFDGVSSYMTVPNSPSINPVNSISFMAIVKPAGFYPGTCGSNQIFGKGSSSDDENGFYCVRFTDFSTNHCALSYPDTLTEQFNIGYGPSTLGTGALDTSIYVRTGTWYTIIYTYDGNVSKLYLNGNLITINTTANLFTPNSDPLYIGKDGNPSTPYLFNGIIDEIRIYDRPLSAKEALALSKVTE